VAQFFSGKFWLQPIFFKKKHRQVFMIKGPKEANLVVSFRSQRSAADAVELGRGNSKGLE